MTGSGTAAKPTRRTVLTTGAGAITITVLSDRVIAEPSDLANAINTIAKGIAPKTGRVTLTIPELAENGNAVGMTVEVQSPMTAADHVKTIHILSEKNPIVDVVRFHLGPRAGRARVSTNIRLATTQRIVALAVMSDGSIWQGHADVIVTLAACIDAG